MQKRRLGRSDLEVSVAPCTTTAPTCRHGLLRTCALSSRHG
jgi:hypothetical protein